MKFHIYGKWDAPNVIIPAHLHEQFMKMPFEDDNKGHKTKEMSIFFDVDGQQIDTKIKLFKNMFYCVSCNAHMGPVYMVHDELWLQHCPKDVLMCYECFESRLGRKLQPSDLTDAPCNGKFLEEVGYK